MIHLQIFFPFFSKKSLFKKVIACSHIMLSPDEIKRSSSSEFQRGFLFEINTRDFSTQNMLRVSHLITPLFDVWLT